MKKKKLAKVRDKAARKLRKEFKVSDDWVLIMRLDAIESKTVAKGKLNHKVLAFAFL